MEHEIDVSDVVVADGNSVSINSVPDKIATLDLERGPNDPPDPPPTYKSVDASDLQLTEDEGPLNGLPVGKLTVIVAAASSGGGGLALALAEAVATGGPVLGRVAAAPSRVFYADRIRPIKAIAAALHHRPDELGNLRILASEHNPGHWTIGEEVSTARHFGAEPALIVLANLGRDNASLNRGIPTLAVLPVRTEKLSGLHALPQNVLDQIKDADTVMLLQAVSEGGVRLTRYVYGELTEDILVEKGGAWTPIGKAVDSVLGKRQAAVLEAVRQAGKEGISYDGLALLFDWKKNNAYQAVFQLGAKLVKRGKLFYLPEFAPIETDKE